LAKLTPKTAAERSALVLSKLPAGGSHDPDLNLLVLLIIAATVLAVATLAHALSRRRALAADGRAMAVPGGAQTSPSSPPFTTPRIVDTGESNAVRAIGYVSGPDAGALAEPSVRKQIAAIDEVCAQQGWELTEIVRDVRSPSKQGESPALAYAVERLTGENSSCLVVAELGRLSESAAELSRIIQSLLEREVGLVAVDVDINTWTGEGRLAAEALIYVGRLGWPAVHDLPPLRKHIVAMRSSGMSLQAIADRLNAEGVPTLGGGKLWQPSSVQVALGYRPPGQSRVTGSLPKDQTRSGREWR
jgi:hypothetical protein